MATIGPQPAGLAATDADEKFDFGFSGPEGEFNFTKFLDDPPKPDAGAPAVGRTSASPMVVPAPP